MLLEFDSSKQGTILKAAFDVFSSYGFKRTSMDDIAKAAGVSRPALYQSFANKGEIFRAILSTFFTGVESAWDSIIAAEHSVVTRLAMIFDVGIVQPHAMMEQMPHGEEIIGLKNEIAEDMFDAFNQRLNAAFIEVIKSDLSQDQITADNISMMLSRSIAGMKADGLQSSELKSEFDVLLRISAAAMKTSA